MTNDSRLSPTPFFLYSFCFLFQTNGICERFHKTILQELYQVTFRKNLYTDLESLQKDLDVWLVYYNEQRTHQGKMYCGRTPMVTLEEGKRLWKEKFVE